MGVLLRDCSLCGKTLYDLFEENMLVFIDESGIHKPIGYSTFVMVYVTELDYTILEQQVLQLEKSMNLKSFHWAQSSWAVKEKFMERALMFHFKAKIIICPNPVHTQNVLEKMLLQMLIENDIHQVIIDGKKPKGYERRIKKVLRDKGISVRKLKTVHDAQSAGIRLADMAAGLSRTYFDGKNSAKITPYFELLKQKTLVISKQ
jgi:hypothetical protein